MSASADEIRNSSYQGRTGKRVNGVNGHSDVGSALRLGGPGTVDDFEAGRCERLPELGEVQPLAVRPEVPHVAGRIHVAAQHQPAAGAPRPRKTSQAVGSRSQGFLAL